MKCPECDFENPADTRFCGNCGTKIKPAGDFFELHTKTAQIPLKEIERGTTIADRYEVIEELGRGGMGNVYRVVDKKINEEMALKLLHPVIATEKKTIERFKNELKLARKITHKNVCRMHDLNEEKGTLYITMEYVPGEDLKSMIRMTGQLSMSRTLSIAKQICDGLAEAHRLRVVHRDLKSRNIMIDKEGNARIMDFGIARSLKAEGITGDGIMVGTPEYMSPEQVKGEEVDQRSDIYSLGIVLFEMVTGKIPFEGDTSLTIALKHKTEAPPNPQDFNAQIPEHLNRVILKCLEKDREKRYQTVDDLASELSSLEEEISTEERALPRKKINAVPSLKRYWPFIFRGILPAVVVVILGYMFLNKILPTSKTGWRNSIAVLPIEDLSLQKDQESLCEGLTDSIITRLRILMPELKVIQKRSVMKYKDSKEEIKEIGKKLQVATILELGLHRENNKILLTANLSSVEDGSQLWSGIIERELTSIFEIQNDISRSIAKALKIPLEEKRFEAVKQKDTTKIKAYECYLLGKHFIEKKYYYYKKKEDFEEGLRMYNRAISIDPNYALAYWGIGNAYEARYNNENNEEDLDLMQQYYFKAYQKNSNLAEASAGLGWVHYYKNNWDMAYASYRTAFELDPNNSQINFDIGSFLRSIGLYKKALKYYERSVELDPLYISSYLLFARCSMYIGEFEEGANILRKAMEIEKDDFRIRYYYIIQLIMMKKYDEAEREIDATDMSESDTVRIQYLRAWIFAARGEKEKALSLIKDVPSYSFGVTSINSLLGMKDEAIKHINEGIETGRQELHLYLYSYPSLINNHYYNNLRNDPRFEKIVREERKIYEEKLKKYDKL